MSARLATYPAARKCMSTEVSRAAATRSNVEMLGLLPPASSRAITDWVVCMREFTLAEPVSLTQVSNLAPELVRDLCILVSQLRRPAS